MYDINEDIDDNAIEDLGEEELSSFVEYVQRVSSWPDEMKEWYEQGKVFPLIVDNTFYHEVKYTSTYSYEVLNHDIQEWIDMNLEGTVYYISDWDCLDVVTDEYSSDKYKKMTAMVLFFESPEDLMAFKLKWC